MGQNEMYRKKSPVEKDQREVRGRDNKASGEREVP
jgi:hypothetical protein